MKSASPLIVGIGASAGGLEAFTQLLQALPADTGMAFVLVQHLEPKHESILTKLLAKATRMPVQEVREGMSVEANHVYVIPANADLSLMDGLLHVARRRAPAGHHLPIDYFFRSLAQTRGSRAIGVILSGTASDGTAGLKAIKVEGGITLAQQPESAKFDGMPRSAIAAGCVDLVLPPQRIATELARIAHHPFVMGMPLEAAPVVPAKEEDWTRLFRLLRTGCGVDFTFYKKSTIKRRLARRMAVHKIDDMGAYLKFMEGNQAEIDALFREILINVTSFFREPEVFKTLRTKVLPQIVAGKRARDPVRIWVPGCSSGEEAYSIAICALECLGERAADTPIQIFATDVDETAIEKARTGRYPEDELREVSPQRLRRFFSRVNGHYEVVPSLRELCVFARHDVTKDPPFSKLDLISCRNVLIYFEAPLQKKVLASFHYALKDKGVLLLGKSESLGAFTDLFSITDWTNKFFAKNTAARLPVEVVQSSYDALAPRGKPAREAVVSLDLEKEADRIVWERYAHAGVVVNSNLQILHFRGDTSPYLRPAPGRASFDLLGMVREELVMELRAAIQKARKSSASVRRQGIAIRHERGTTEVNLEVRPMPVPGGGHERCFLILFEQPELAVRPPSGPATEKGPAQRSRAAEVRRLQNELARTREYVQAVIREQESTNEELKTANEEALSSMEELQSTNEELETAKEELQSSNEELVTLNEQLQNRNAELSRLSDELSNVLSTIDIPILILDSGRRIRRFTPPAQNLLGLLPGDIGRPIDNLQLGVNVPDLKKLTAAVMQGAAEWAHEVQSTDGCWYSLRVRPFRTREEKIEGVLLAFVDINELKRSQQALQKERNLVASTLDAARDLLVLILDTEGRIVQFNRACQELTGYSATEAKGRLVWDFLLVPEEVEAVRGVFKEVASGTPNQFENYWLTKAGARRLIAWKNSVVLGEDGLVEFVIATGIDQTERAEAQQRAQESEATLHALMETAAQAIVAANREGRITLANVTTEKMFGYERRELLGQPIEILIPQRLRERHVAHRARWFAEPRNRPMGVGLELMAVRRDGSEFPVEISLSYLHDRDGLLGVAFISDITERRKNQQTLLDYQKQLQRLTANLISTQETENRDLAREMHDAFSQELAALRMEVFNLLQSTDTGSPLAESLEMLGKKIGKLADDIHRTSRQLHPAILEELGLEAALREECERFSQQLGIPVEFTPAEVPAALPEEVALCLYRVAQESLHNIRKHVGATKVRVRVAGSPDGISLQVADSGDGFDVEEARKSGGLGLISMEERVRLVNGKFFIRSQKGIGTLVEVFVPLGEKAE
ncbi:MAG TPA: chemotaxis protein CheB [Terriglobales bacterium]|nr:chemotaxis protein CheB [Terriglobales bacterium]